MKAEVAKREIESLDYYLQNHTNDYSEESHTAMMMAISALSKNKGEWINLERKGVCYPFWGRYKCSVCNGLSGNTDFCPNCGADMRGGKDEISH